MSLVCYLVHSQTHYVVVTSLDLSLNSMIPLKTISVNTLLTRELRGGIFAFGNVKVFLVKLKKMSKLPWSNCCHRRIVLRVALLKVSEQRNTWYN